MIEILQKLIELGGKTVGEENIADLKRVADDMQHLVEQVAVDEIERDEFDREMAICIATAGNIAQEIGLEQTQRFSDAIDSVRDMIGGLFSIEE